MAARAPKDGGAGARLEDERHHNKVEGRAVEEPVQRNLVQDERLPPAPSATREAGGPDSFIEEKQPLCKTQSGVQGPHFSRTLWPFKNLSHQCPSGPLKKTPNTMNAASFFERNRFCLPFAMMMSWPSTFPVPMSTPAARRRPSATLIPIRRMEAPPDPNQALLHRVRGAETQEHTGDSMA
jgi:hypothetical protein